MQIVNLNVHKFLGKFIHGFWYKGNGYIREVHSILEYDIESGSYFAYTDDLIAVSFKSLAFAFDDLNEYEAYKEYYLGE